MNFLTQSKSLLVASVLWAGAANGLSAHEFWMEPVDSHVPVGTTLMVNTTIGVAFAGDLLANFPSMQKTVDLNFNGQSVAVSGPVSQQPALQAPTLGDGLHVMRYQSRDFQVTYQDFQKFVSFLKEAERPDILDLHRARGLPEENLREVYFRYSKTLIDVGSGQGSDSFLGMPFELVALTNPYADPAPQAIELELRFLEQPQPKAAIHVFRRAPDGTISNFRLRTDDQGRFTVPATDKGYYLINAIHILEASERMKFLLGASWQSLWASMTYDIE